MGCAEKLAKRNYRLFRGRRMPAILVDIIWFYQWFCVVVCTIFSTSNLTVVFLPTRFYYTIVSPKVLRPNSEYHVAVSTQGTTQPTTVVVDVGGKQDSGGVLKVTQFVKVDPFATRIVRLEVSCWITWTADRQAEGAVFRLVSYVPCYARPRRTWVATDGFDKKTKIGQI